MTVKEYVTEFLPERFGKHESCGKVALLILMAEKAGDKDFSQEVITEPRVRAELGIPYQIDDLAERERVLNVLELCILKHRGKEHGENWDERIMELQKTTSMSDEEAAMVMGPLSFWSG
jgi:hypothetical protein